MKFSHSLSMRSSLFPFSFITYSLFTPFLRAIRNFGEVDNHERLLQGVSETPVSVLCFWKSFCARYYNNWCKINAACGVLVDSFTGTVGLIRKNILSVFRSLEYIELFVQGMMTLLILWSYSCL